MGSINRISLLPRRRPGMWCLWTWAILDTRHQCVPSIRAKSRCVDKSVYWIFIISPREALFQSFSSLFSSLFSSSLRSLLQRVTQSWEERTLMRCWWNTSVRNLARSTSLMSSQSPGLWSDSTRSVKNWKKWWAPTPPTCRSTLSASWMTSMCPENWTGRPTRSHLLV